MGAHSTLRITRKAAIETAFDHIFKDKLTAMKAAFVASTPDKMLEEIVDEFLDDKLYNCIIVNDDEENDNFALG